MRLLVFAYVFIFNWPFILRYIRFDSKSTRGQRILKDKFALFSETWYAFIENSQKMYKPAQFLTVDEQLLSSKTRCKFTQYMPKKPDKFGIKFWILACLATKYILNGFPYLGKELTKPLPKGVLQGEYVVQALLEPYFERGHNCTTDNFFTSTKLGEYLLTKKTTLIGTVKKNKRNLPTVVKEKIDLHSTRFFESKGVSISF